jgi:hypothetical protein
MRYRAVGRLEKRIVYTPEKRARKRNRVVALKGPAPEIRYLKSQGSSRCELLIAVRSGQAPLDSTVSIT